MMADEPKPVGRGKTQAAAEQAKPYTGQEKAADPKLPGSAKPVKGKCGAKLRKSDPARYCNDNPTPGRTRCYRHGGKTPAGINSPNFKHGLRSGYLPEGLKERYDAALADPALMRIRDDVAMTEALLAHFTSKLKAGRPVTAKQEARILALMENRRRHIETEAKRLKDLHQMISIDRYLAQMTVVGNLIRKHVTDTAMLDALHEDLQRHLLRSAEDIDGADGT